MHAMILEKPGTALQHREVATPAPSIGQVKVRVLACAVCRTDLHVVDGELPHPRLPLIPGHQIVGLDEQDRKVGVPWLGWTCGECRFCRNGQENLCDAARFTGY